jgi:hypothetical protein
MVGLFGARECIRSSLSPLVQSEVVYPALNRGNLPYYH